MADIRINSLPSTATSFNTDDYIAIDGASGGTRKMLASTLPLTDVTLGGTSGPSVKSTLSARAPRQGLVFDGTAGTTVSVSAFGTSDFSCAFVASVNNFTNYNALVGSTTNSGNFFFGTRSSVGDLGVIITGTGSWITSGFTPTVGKNYSFVYARSGTTGKFYVDGVLVSTVTDSANYTTGLNQFGANAGTSNVWPGVIEQGFIYNRALSASEVVALYEAGAPSGADYNSASSTTLLSGTFVNGIGGGTYAYSTFSGASATGFTATSTSTSYKTGVSPTAFSVVKGRKYRLTYTLTLNSGTAPKASIGDPSNSSYMDAEPTLVAGTNTIEFTCTTTASNAKLNFWVGAVSDFAISGVALIPLGLLLAPDAAQAGGGLTWYDTSGNAANITLPASGVSWNVPSSQKTASGWTFGGPLNVDRSTTGTAAKIQASSIAAGDQVNLFFGKSDTSYNEATIIYKYVNNGSTDNSLNIGFYGADSLFNFKANGNYLIGTTTDSANGKLQLATHTTSAGGIGFGTDTSLYRSGTGVLQLDGSNVARLTMKDVAAGLANYIASDGGNLYIGVTDTPSPSNDAIVLDPSKNVTFAGKIQVGTSSVTGAQLVVVGPASASARTAIIRSQTAGDKTYSAGLFSKYDNDSTTSQVFVQFSINNDGTASGQINANGASQAAFGSWSDARLKKNIVSLGSQWNAIKSLRPVEFDYIDSEGGGHQIGFIAQEVQPIYSDVVGTRPDGMFTLSGMGKNEARLIKALQEAMLRIEALEAKLA